MSTLPEPKPRESGERFVLLFFGKTDAVPVDMNVHPTFSKIGFLTTTESRGQVPEPDPIRTGGAGYVTDTLCKNGR